MKPSTYKSDPANRSPLKAIRRHCLDCSGGMAPEREHCPCTDCNLYPFRRGKRLPKMPVDATEPHVEATLSTEDAPDGLGAAPAI